VIDLHSHLLPAVDDGAQTLDQAVQALETMRGAGVTAVCLTPHLTARHAAYGVPPAFDVAYEQLAAAAPAGIQLHRGVELMLDRPLAADAATYRSLTLGGSRYLLVEFTGLVAASAAVNALQQVAQLGLVPVLAHPERYACTTPALVRTWKDNGALMQVDANTLLAPRTRGERARALLAAGLVDLLAADNHGDARTVAPSYAALRAHGAESQAELLLVHNPGAILADQLTEAVAPVRIRTSLLDRIRQLLSPEA
jgi:protein-tyrosine phosphatase